MRSSRLENLLWPGMIIAGLALAAAVWTAWPESTTRVVLLPYGESMPKTPRVSVEKPKTVRVVAARPKASAQSAPAPAPVTVEDAGGVLGVVEPEPVAEPEPELPPQESPEELGAEPLPGTTSP